MSNDELIMVGGGLIALVLGVIDIVRTEGQSLPAWGIAVLGAVFLALVLI